jgi:hypothetical protein
MYLGSIYSEPAEPDDRELMINTQLHLLWHPQGICKQEQFWLEAHWNRVRRWDTNRKWESTISPKQSVRSNDGNSVSNGSIVGQFQLYRVEKSTELAGSVPVVTIQFRWWSPPILLREFRPWYVNYAALHGASFGHLQFSISSKLSKQLWKYRDFSPKIHVFVPSLSEFWRYRKLEMTKRCAMPSCIIHLPSFKSSDQCWWT